MSPQIGAFVGATGGAGTTRLSIECAGVLAKAGRDVAVFDASFQTAGLASYAKTGIEPDVTALVTGEADLDAALTPQPLDLPGTVSLCPARAPFERLARAKTAGAATQFEQQLAAASLSHDVVLVDTPPIGGNQAIAAVNAADQVAVVTPDTVRGRDGLATTRERLADIGIRDPAVIANRSDGSLGEADAHVPTAETTDPRDCPSCLPPDEQFTPAIVTLVETLFGITAEIEIPESGRLSGLIDS